MANAFRELAFTVELFGATHLFCILFDSVYDVLYFSQTAGLVFGYGFAELLQTELHVVELRNDFAQLFRYVGQLSLEFAELQPCPIGRFRSNGFEGL